ncbi:MAG TPA: shikimate kinase [Streptosporangiaceae bacterium]
MTDDQPNAPAAPARLDDPGAPLIVLTGPPAAGKSSVGRLLAERLGAAFVDTDAEIEAAVGKPVGDIFVDDGEAAFRDLERAAARRALTAAGAVVALGSGAVTDPGVQQMLGGQPVAYLSVGFPAIARRLGLDRPRVVMPGNPRGQLRRMLDERRPLYEQLAAVTVEADELAPEEIADEIADWLAAHPRPVTR